MISITADSEANILRCPPPSESDFNLELQEIEVVLSSASTTTITIDDGSYERSTGASVRYDAIVAYLPQVGNATVPKFESANTSIATVASNGSITTVGSGVVDIFCRAFKTSKKVAHNARFQNPTTVETFLNYLDGTLGSHSTAVLDSLINAGGQTALFSEKNNQTNTYARNAACWASSLDWSGVSPTNSAEAFKRGGTLISPRHLVWANHFNIPNGTTLTFVNNANEVFTKTVINSLRIGATDIRVGVLNSDVDQSVTYYAVLPADYRDYLVSVLLTYLPLITTDQEQKALCRELINVGASGQSWAHRAAQTGNRADYTENLVVGDSGQPLFMLINGQLVLLGSHYSAGAVPQLANYTTEINAAMTTLGGGYQLTTADLSAFTNFAN
jgi:hypothetical protein